MIPFSNLSCSYIAYLTGPRVGGLYYDCTVAQYTRFAPPLPTPILSHTQKTFAMSNKNNGAVIPYNLAAGGAPIREFLYSNFSPETLRQQAATLLSNKDLVRNILGMTQREQTRFLDKVDEARQGLPLFQSLVR
jgi:hypothetical protein